MSEHPVRYNFGIHQISYKKLNMELWIIDKLPRIRIDMILITNNTMRIMQPTSTTMMRTPHSHSSLGPNQKTDTLDSMKQLQVHRQVLLIRSPWFLTPSNHNRIPISFQDRLSQNRMRSNHSQSIMRGSQYWWRRNQCQPYRIPRRKSQRAGWEKNSYCWLIMVPPKCETQCYSRINRYDKDDLTHSKDQRRELS